MRVQGSLQAPLLRPLKRRTRAVEKQDTSGKPAGQHLPVIQLTPEADFIPGEEALKLDERQLTARAKRALEGYWSVTHQSHLWVEWRRVDLYI